MVVRSEFLRMKDRCDHFLDYHLSTTPRVHAWTISSCLIPLLQLRTDYMSLEFCARCVGDSYLCRLQCARDTSRDRLSSLAIWSWPAGARFVPSPWLRGGQSEGHHHCKRPAEFCRQIQRYAGFRGGSHTWCGTNGSYNDGISSSPAILMMLH